MAITILRKKVKDEMQNLAFQTKYISEELKDGTTKEHLICEVNTVDDKLKNLTIPTTYTVDRTEEEFHTELRKVASEKEELIRSLSSNPEWNPKEYIKNLNDE